MTGGVVGGGDRLHSWKEIAAYLGKDAGTVRRWERTRGLPVHRVPGGKGTSVYAYTAEIEAWLKSPGRETDGDEAEPIEGTPRVRRFWVGGAVAAVAIVAALAVVLTRDRQVNAAEMRVHVTETSVIAVDGAGRELWVHPLADGWRHKVSDVSETSQVVGGDDPRIYFITSHRQRSDTTIEGGELTALDLEGRERFTFRFFDTVRFGGKPYGQPWGITAFSALDGDPAPRLAVAAHHWLWGPSLLAILDSNGNRLGTYANDGWIEQLTWLSPERLVFAGFSESRNGGMVGLLDPRQLDGQSPEPVNSPHYCETCGKHPPVKLLVMPRTEVNLLTESRFNRAVLEKAGDRLIVRTIEVPSTEGQGAADAIYEFSASLDLINASFGEYYWRIHDRLQLEKKLDHDRAHCPFRNGPGPIHIWAPESGWSILNNN